MKEQILKELKKKDILSQSIMLNWLRSQTNITFSKEEKFNKLLKDIIIEEVSQAISKTREEIIREIEENLPFFLAGKLDNDETEESRSGRNKVLREVKKLLNKLKK